MTISNQERRLFSSQILSVFATGVVLFGLAKIIYFLYPYPYASMKEVMNTYRQLTSFENCLPEPAEQLTYKISLIAAPIFLLVFYFAAYKGLGKIRGESWQRWSYPALVLAALFFTYQASIVNIFGAEPLRFLGISFGKEVRHVIETPYKLPYSFMRHLVFFIGAIFLVFCVSSSDSKRTFFEKGLRLFFGFFCAVAVATVAAITVCDTKIVTFDISYLRHFLAVFSAVAHVHLGEAQLLNVSAQYGLYAHFLEPIFRIIGLSVLKYTFVMSLLIACNYGLISFFLWKSTGNKAVALLGILSLFFCCDILHRYPFLPILPYFQYAPIRMVFPALLIFLSWRYFQTRNKILYIVSFPLYSLAMLWNLETGIVCFGSWIAALFYDEVLLRKDRGCIKPILRHLGGAVLAFFLVLAAFLFSMRLRYGGWPDLIKATDAVRMYYLLGFGMMPMPPIGLWQIVAFSYLVGLSYAVRCLFLCEDPVKARMVFLISVLGAGLFSYYQGRSAITNLSPAAYPSILLMTLATDQMVCFLKTAKVQTKGIEFFWRIVVVSFLVYALSYSVSALGSPLFRNWWCHAFRANGFPFSLKEKTGNTDYKNQEAFIRKNLHDHSKPGDKVVFVMKYETLHNLSFNVRQPWDGPSIYEKWFRKDYENFKNFLRDCQSCKVFVMKECSPQAVQAFLDPEVAPRYRFVNEADDGSVKFFQRER